MQRSETGFLFIHVNIIFPVTCPSGSDSLYDEVSLKVMVPCSSVGDSLSLKRRAEELLGSLFFCRNTTDVYTYFMMNADRDDLMGSVLSSVYDRKATIQTSSILRA